jgi:hypothetical protein
VRTGGAWWNCTRSGPRRSRCGELVQWDTSTHDWLEGRGERIYLISMIDDATSRLFARFVRQDTSEENRRLLRSYLERFGRPLAFYTDKAGMFQVAVKSERQEQREGLDRQQMPPTQIAKALREVGIVWIPAHSPQAKGRTQERLDEEFIFTVRLLSAPRYRGFQYAFFGAGPVVASALGIRLGATPRGRFHCKPSPSTLRRKEGISTLLGNISTLP